MSLEKAGRKREVLETQKRMEESKAEHEASITDFGEKIGGARKDTAERGYTMTKDKVQEETGPAWKKRYVAMEKVDGSGWTIGDTKAQSILRSAGRDQVFPTKEAAEQAIPLLAAAKQFYIYQENDGHVIYKKVSDRKRLRMVQEAFPSREEAMKYMAVHAEGLLNTKTTFGEEILPTPEIAKRIGLNAEPVP